MITSLRLDELVNYDDFNDGDWESDDWEDDEDDEWNNCILYDWISREFS